jgi:hypothetical protein
MRMQISTFTSHLDRYSHAFVLVDAERRVLYANAAAREAAKLSDSLTIGAGRLILLHPERQGELIEAIRSVTSGNAARFHHIEVGRLSLKTPYRLLVFNAPDSGAMPFGLAEPSAAILILDSDSELTTDRPSFNRCIRSLRPNAESLGISFSDEA